MNIGSVFTLVPTKKDNEKILFGKKTTNNHCPVQATKPGVRGWSAGEQQQQYRLRPPVVFIFVSGFQLRFHYRSLPSPDRASLVFPPNNGQHVS